MAETEQEWMLLSELWERAIGEFEGRTPRAIEDALILAFLEGRIAVRGVPLLNIEDIDEYSEQFSEVSEIDKSFWRIIDGSNVRWNESRYIYGENPRDDVDSRVEAETNPETPYYCYYEIQKSDLEARADHFREWIAYAKRKPLKAFTSLEDVRSGKKKAGRKEGTGSYRADDEPLIDEMNEYRKQDQKLSIWPATDKVVARAKGGGSDDSRRKRLMAAYKKKYGEW